MSEMERGREPKSPTPSPRKSVLQDNRSTDPYLANATADMTAYILLEEAFCDCDGLRVCGWDDD